MRVGLILPFVALFAACYDQCKTDADCPAEFRCDQPDGQDAVCVAAEGEGEGEGEEGEGEGEGEGELVHHVAFVDEGSDVTAVVYAANKVVQVEARDADDAVVSSATCTETTVSTGEPAETNDDTNVTVRCSTVSLENDAGVSGTLSLKPVTAEALNPSATVTAADLASASLAESLVTTTADTSCVFVDSVPRTGGTVTVRCTREGVDAADVELELTVTAAVNAVVLGLNGQTLVARVTQASATSCSVECEGGTPSSSTITTDGTVDVPFATVTTGATESCTVTCTGSDETDVNGDSFRVFGGPVDSQARLDALAASDAVALQGDIGLINPTAFNLGNPALKIISGVVNVQCNGAAVLAEIGASSIQQVGGSLTVDDCDRPGFDVFFDGLTSVDGALSVSDNSNLGSLSLSSLTSVGGAFTASGNPRLVTLEMGSIRTVGTSGGPADDFTFTTNATEPALVAPLTISLPTTPPLVRLFGKARIRENGQISDQSAEQVAAKFQADSAARVGENVE